MCDMAPEAVTFDQVRTPDPLGRGRKCFRIDSSDIETVLYLVTEPGMQQCRLVVADQGVYVLER